MKNKVCIISNLYDPFVRGGAEKVAQWMAEGISNKEVVVVSTKPVYGLKKEQRKNQTIYRFKPLNLFYYLNDYKHNILVRLVWHVIDMFNIHSYFVIKKILINEKPDVVVTHNLKGIGYLVPMLIRKLGLKHIHYLHDVQLSVPTGLIIKGKENSFIVKGFFTKIYEFVCKKLFLSPNVVISPSKWLLDFYFKKGFFIKSISKTLNNPIKISCERSIAKEKLSNVFIYVGQIEEHKGISWLVNVWNKNNIKSKLIVVGVGSQLQSLKGLNSSKIEFVGYLKPEAMKYYFEIADFLIMPSFCYENSPTVIPLSYQFATPVICADIGGAGELVENKKTGFLFESGNEDSFLKVINSKDVFSNNSNIMYFEMSRNALNKSKDFSMENFIMRFNLILSDEI